MEKPVYFHYKVSGKVQGVWFRASTQKKAEALNMSGWVRNLSDGAVELVAGGTKIQHEKLFQWLHEGPETAKVTQVVQSEIEDQNLPEKFNIKK